MKRKSTACPYLTAPNHNACGTDLCHLQQVRAGADGIITTCGGYGSPAYRHEEIMHEGGRSTPVWVGGSPWPAR